MVALNGSLVGLVIDRTQYVCGPGPSRGAAHPHHNQQLLIEAAAEEATARGLPGILSQPPPHCFLPHAANPPVRALYFPLSHSFSHTNMKSPCAEQPHCVGLGIVSRIDPRTKEIFVITPLPHAAVRRGLSLSLSLSLSLTLLSLSL